MIRSTIHSARGFLAEPLNRTSVALMATTLITAVLGVLFWAVATHEFTPAEIGRDGSLITAMMSLAVICDLSLNNIVLRFFPQLRERIATRVWQTYAIGATSALLGGILFVAVAPLVSDSFQFFREKPEIAIIFPISVALWAIFVLQDSVLTALTKATWLPIENSIFSVAKIVMLLVLAAAAAQFGVFIGWIVPLVAIIPVINFLIFTRVVPQAAERQAGASGVVSVLGWRRLATFVSQDIVSTGISTAGTSAMPLIVLAIAGPSEAAFFVVPFALIDAFDDLFFAVSVAVVTEGARQRERIPAMLGMATRRLLTFTLPCALLICAAAPLLLWPNGSLYMDEGASVLRLLALASIFRATVLLFAAILRLSNNGRGLLIVQGGGTTLTVALVLLLTEQNGPQGAALGWLLGQAATALAIVIPLIRSLRDPQRVVIAGGDAELAEIEELTIRSKSV